MACSLRRYVAIKYGIDKGRLPKWRDLHLLSTFIDKNPSLSSYSKPNQALYIHNKPEKPHVLRVSVILLELLLNGVAGICVENDGGGTHPKYGTHSGNHSQYCMGSLPDISIIFS